MERRQDRAPDAERAAHRLSRPLARAALVAKRALDIVLSLAMLIALLPLFAIVLTLLAFAGEGYLERRRRLGRKGEKVTLTRFHALPGGGFGRWLEKLGARELPLLWAVLR